MGRLWQTLILSQWRADLAWLPVETLVCEQQKEYYRVLGEADQDSDCTCFITFMLQAIAGALREGISDSEKPCLSGEVTVEMSGENGRLNISKTGQSILNLLKTNPTMTMPKLAQELQVSSRTIERQISQLQKLGLLERVGSTKAGSWRVR